MSASLLRYRVMAYVTGTGLLILVLVGVPLQIVGHDGVVAVVGPLHGFLFIVYLIAAFDLANRCRWSLIATIAVMAAGTIPFVSFYAERRVTHSVSARLAERDRSGEVGSTTP